MVAGEGIGAVKGTYGIVYGVYCSMGEVSVGDCWLAVGSGCMMCDGWFWLDTRNESMDGLRYMYPYWIRSTRYLRAVVNHTYYGVYCTSISPRHCIIGSNPRICSGWLPQVYTEYVCSPRDKP